MPRIVNFNNRQSIEPGVMSKILGLFSNTPIAGSFGNVVLIDTGIGKGYGYGSGITGTLASGEHAIYEFDGLIDAKNSLRGGILWDLMDYLWSPSNNGNGPDKLFYARAATTEAASVQLDFVTTANAPAGSVTISAKNEGVGGNGVLTGSVVTRGYSAKLKAGVVDTSKFILEFFEGQYRGVNEDGYEYEIEESVLANTTIVRSTEFNTCAQLLAWMATDFNFGQYFAITDSTTSTLNMISANLTSLGTHQLFAGGTEVYSSTQVDNVLAQMTDLDNSLFLCDQYGITTSPTSQEIEDGTNQGANSTANQKILNYINNLSTYTQKIMFIGGGEDASQFTRPSTSDGSLEIADFYNHSSVVVVHSGIKVVGKFVNSSDTFKYQSALYHAAMVCGRIAGLEPQVPGTYKDLRILGLKHTLTKTQREQALLNGVLHTRFVTRMGYVINQSINTKQPNDNIVENDGSSPEISIIRIFHQLNKELIINATPRFVGGNLNTSSAEDVKAFTDGYLSSRTSNRLKDDLIIKYQNITVTLQQDKWFTTYCFVANSPINRLFFTGYSLDPTLALQQPAQ